MNIDEWAMAARQPEQVPFLLTSGVLCLDFANTLRGRLQPQTRELLQSYRDLVAFGEATGITPPDQAAALRAAAESHPDEAAQVLRRAIDLREALYSVFVARAFGRPIAPADLAEINAALATALAHRQVVAAEAGFVWGWAEHPPALDRILWPVALSAAELLTSDRLAMVHKCAADDCGIIFLDTSRSHRRRWCDMQICGNRAKVGRFRARQRSQSS